MATIVAMKQKRVVRVKNRTGSIMKTLQLQLYMSCFQRVCVLLRPWCINYKNYKIQFDKSIAYKITKLNALRNEQTAEVEKVGK